MTEGEPYRPYDCTPYEYEWGYDERLKAGEFAVGAHYILRIARVELDAVVIACQTPFLVTRVYENRDGRQYIKGKLVDDDFKSGYKIGLTILDNGVVEEAGRFLVAIDPTNDNKEPINEAYLKRYEDTLIKEFRDLQAGPHPRHNRPIE